MRFMQKRRPTLGRLRVTSPDTDTSAGTPDPPGAGVQQDVHARNHKSTGGVHGRGQNLAKGPAAPS